MVTGETSWVTSALLAALGATACVDDGGTPVGDPADPSQPTDTYRVTASEVARDELAVEVWEVDYRAPSHYQIRGLSAAAETLVAVESDRIEELVRISLRLGSDDTAFTRITNHVTNETEYTSMSLEQTATVDRVASDLRLGGHGIPYHHFDHCLQAVSPCWKCGNCIATIVGFAAAPCAIASATAWTVASIGVCLGAIGVAGSSCDPQTGYACASCASKLVGCMDWFTGSGWAPSCEHMGSRLVSSCSAADEHVCCADPDGYPNNACVCRADSTGVTACPDGFIYCGRLQEPWRRDEVTCSSGSGGGDGDGDGDGDTLLGYGCVGGGGRFCEGDTLLCHGADPGNNNHCADCSCTNDFGTVRGHTCGTTATEMVQACWDAC